ncbi:hypothetical protein BDR26DRAFT_861099 [Obelidium mucronatum]|nr:hypothetical protein BDR26DRAFT_861099 [Obelidium mucronatum]
MKQVIKHLLLANIISAVFAAVPDPYSVLIESFQAAPSCLGKCLTGATNSTTPESVVAFCGLATGTNATQQNLFTACLGTSCSSTELSAVSAIQRNQTVLGAIPLGCKAVLSSGGSSSSTNSGVASSTGGAGSTSATTLLKTTSKGFQTATSWTGASVLMIIVSVVL